jgi:uncharacterized protein YjbJ (UPF0337 family)
LAVAAGDIRVGAGIRRARKHNAVMGSDKMKSSTENKIEGGFHEEKGKIKEKMGELVKNSNLEAEGTVEKIAGKIQKKFGRLKESLKSPESRGAQIMGRDDFRIYKRG